MNCYIKWLKIEREKKSILIFFFENIFEEHTMLSLLNYPRVLVESAF